MSRILADHQSPGISSLLGVLGIQHLRPEKSDAPNTTTTIQDIPEEFKPAFTSLFNSAFAAARTATGQPPPFGLGVPQTEGADQQSSFFVRNSPADTLGVGGTGPFAAPTNYNLPFDPGSSALINPFGGGLNPFQQGLSDSLIQLINDFAGSIIPEGSVIDCGCSIFRIYSSASIFSVIS